MPNSLKIYFPAGYLLITNAFPDQLDSNPPYHKEEVLDNPTDKELLGLVEKVFKGELTGGYTILTKEPENCLTLIASGFKAIEAAGGIVENERNELLFIFRRGKWDLPKGKIDDNESPETAALREIEEETGAKGLTLLTKLGETYHVYNMYGENVLKTTHWYLLKSTTNQVLSPQLEEDITAIKWFRKEDLNEPLTNSYPTIIDLVNIYLYREANKL